MTRFFFAFLLLIISFISSYSLAEDINPLVKKEYYESFIQDELIIARMNLDNLVLSEATLAYSDSGKIYVSLKEFFKALDFQITINPSGTMASGWFIDLNRKFDLDIEKENVLISSFSHQINPSMLRIVDGDIFVDLDLINKWFPLEIAFKKLEQIFVITSRETLPIQAKMERLAKWDKLSKEQELRDKQKSKEGKANLVVSKYKLTSLPMFDVRLGSGYQSGVNSQNIFDSSSLGIMGNMDLLYLNHSFSYSRSNGIDIARLVSSRKDRNSKLFGPLHATEINLGDVFTPRIPSVARATFGKGFTLTNYPSDYVAEFDSVPITGFAQAGWDVELYQNNSLITFQKVAIDGKYEFQKIPLFSGLNTIKLVFYGPHGEKREEKRYFNVSGDTINQGKIYYRFAANKSGEELIGLSSATNNSIDQKMGKDRLFGELAYKITRHTSLTGNIIKLPEDITGIEKEYRGFVVKSSLYGTNLRFDAFEDVLSKTSATQSSIQTKIWKYDVFFKRDKYHRLFVSEEHQVMTDPIDTTTYFRTAIPVSLPYIVNNAIFSFSGTQDKYYSEAKRDNLNTSISFSPIKKLNLTQSLQSNSFKTKDNTSSVTQKFSNTAFNYRLSDLDTLMFAINYSLAPTNKIQSMNSSLFHQTKEKIGLNLNINHQFSAQGSSANTSYSANISKTYDKFTASLGSSYTNQNGAYGVNLNIFTSIGFDQLDKKLIMSSTPVSNSAMVSARVFVDENNNKIFDKDEVPLSDIEISDASSGKKYKTSQDGIANLPQIAANRRTRLDLSEESVTDPFFVILHKSIDVIAHPGDLLVVDFPILPTGEVSGIANLLGERGTFSPSANVVIELLDENDKVIKSTKSAYDGYYIFDKIIYGKYKMRASREQLSRLKLESEVLYLFELNKNNKQFSNIEFRLRERRMVKNKLSSNGQTPSLIYF